MGYMKKLTAFAPIIAVLVVIVCISVSLGGYTAPVYAAENADAADNLGNAAAAAASAEASASAAQAKGSFDVADGTYEGTGVGFNGDVKVAVTVKDKQITAIEILSSSDDAAFFNRAKGVIDKIIQAQSLDVDVVSGATYSSNGIINAVKNALTGEVDNSSTGAESGGSSSGKGSTSVSAVTDPSSYKDGTYSGTATGFAGPLTVQVVVSGGKISSIKVTSSSDDAGYLNKAKGLISKIISSQSTNVDTVSGATYSSVGIINAVRKALSNAAVSGGSSGINSGNNENENKQDVSGKFPYNDGIYYGVGEGYKSDIKIALVIQDKTIKAILILESGDDAAFFNRAKTIAEEIVEKQNLDVDVVSGATYSSNGILEAVNEAIKEADKATNGSAEPSASAQPSESAKPSASAEPSSSEQPDESEAPTEYIYKDGEYTASVICLPDEDEDFDAYTLSLRLTINSDKIVAVSDIKGDGDSSNDSYINRAANGTSKITGVVTQILEKGTLDSIDTVSRATCTSKSIIEACEKALEEAKIS